jgi:hypothetical protein
MTSVQRHALAWFLLVALLAWSLGGTRSSVEGTVTDADGPVAGATVRRQGRRVCTRTDTQGRFSLVGSTNSADSRRITASKPGYQIASTIASHQPLSLRLLPWPERDNPGYAWIDPTPDPAQTNNCGNCHADIYQEWKGSAHATSAINPKFLQLYAGKARIEHPDGSAVCAACHAPTLAASESLDYDVRTAHGVARSGIHCDYCHKIVDAPVEKIGTRFGRDGLVLLRPSGHDLLTFGPLDDAVRPGESFGAAGVYRESRYCASCHEGIVFGVHAYGTYTEWLDSPACGRGVQCQDCHMAPTGTMTNLAPGKGGVPRAAATLASHHLPGGDRAMLGRSLRMQLRHELDPAGWRIEVEITADRVGHRVPTGFVDRHLILVVEATDEHGRPAPLLRGERLGASAGKWSGSAGVLYGKQLFDDQGRTPSPFWLPVEKVTDTRLIPERPDRREFVFAPAARRATARLWYRRFWQTTADLRGWDDNDILVAAKRLIQ